MAKSKATKEQLTSLIARILELSEDMDLCSTGKELVSEAKQLLGQKLVCDDDVILNINIYSGFEIPTGVDVEDENEYEVTVKFGGKVLDSYNLSVQRDN